MNWMVNFIRLFFWAKISSNESLSSTELQNKQAKVTPSLSLRIHRWGCSILLWSYGFYFLNVVFMLDNFYLTHLKSNKVSGELCYKWNQHSLILFFIHHSQVQSQSNNKSVSHCYLKVNFSIWNLFIPLLCHTTHVYVCLWCSSYCAK